MKKNIIGVSIAMLFAANAMAQSTAGSSVEVYGVLDAAIGTVKYSLNASPYTASTAGAVSATKVAVNNSVSGMLNGGIQGSRIGFRGTEDLGSGLKAIFTLESGINIQNGSLANGAASLAVNPTSVTSTNVSGASSLNGQLFSRQAFIGLSDDTLGKVTFGRQYAPIYDILAAYDPVQFSQAFSPLGNSGSYGGGAGVTENSRQDNSIKYVNKFGDFNVGAMYKLGGVAGHSTAQSAYGVWAGYETQEFGIQAAYQSATDAITASSSAVAGQVAVKNYNTTGYLVAGKYMYNSDLTVRAGYESYSLKKPSDAIATLGYSNYYGYSVATAAATDFTGAERKTNIAFIGGDYNFTQNFNLALGAYDIAPKQSADKGQLDGNIYAYSLLADYHFTKRTDVYAGLLYEQLKGNQYPSATYNTTNSIIAVGMRHKF